MKCVNLLSIIQAYNTFSNSELKQYLDFFRIEMNTSEFEDLTTLVKGLETAGVTNFNNFFVGFKINQINKQFDLLRFSENEVVNIELKRTSTKEKIKRQLIQNRYYLGFLGKTVHTYTFVVDDNKLYNLDQAGELSIVDIQQLVHCLNSQTVINLDDIHGEFNPSNYLVSPFNSTDKFIRGEYFLTEHQQIIKDEIINLFNNEGTFFTSVVGNPGTGKTLLTYDLAKHFMNQQKKTVVVHCGMINAGHYRLKSAYNWSVYPIRDFASILYDEDFDVIILDEVQRIYSNQLELIIGHVRIKGIKCVFSYDPRQCLSSNEYNRRIPDYLEKELNIIPYRLTEKIRSNKEVASFIKNLFDLSKINPNQKYENISIQYFEKAEAVKIFARHLSEQGWNVLNYTSSSYNIVSYDLYQEYPNPNAHNVIGQEFDNIVAFIDNNFMYSHENKLIARRVSGAPNYDLDKMLYQILTRARQKITLVIINNKPVLKKVLDILGIEMEYITN